jgi:hypothetical protein
MNTQANNLFKAISNVETKKMVEVVSETLAFGMHKEKVFTTADLWNIQRQRKSFAGNSGRRFLA